VAQQIKKILEVVDRISQGLKPNEYITNKRLVTELRHRYAGFDYPNPLVAADFCVNSISGYEQRPDGTFEKRYPILFKIALNRYVRYQPQVHGSWACIVINGKKTVIRTS
jgi:hypothetical protein